MKATINHLAVDITESYRKKNLLEYLREELDLTGSKNGCDGTGVCGACTVLLDDKAVKSCKKTVADIENKELVTIEGMAGVNGDLSPLQKAFIDCGSIQCGFCTPGMVMRAHGLLLHNAQPSRDEVRRALGTNLCRCTGYQQIIDAVILASEHYS